VFGATVLDTAVLAVETPGERSAEPAKATDSHFHALLTEQFSGCIYLLGGVTRRQKHADPPVIEQLTDQVTGVIRSMTVLSLIGKPDGREDLGCEGFNGSCVHWGLSLG